MIVASLSTSYVIAQPDEDRGFAWGSSNYDIKQTNYSPQNQITKDTIQHLADDWTNAFMVPPDVPGIELYPGMRARPLVYNGLVFLVTSFNAVFVHNVQTGQPLWYYAYPMNMTDIMIDYPRISPHRPGVLEELTIFDDYLIFPTADCGMVFLDYLTGSPDFRGELTRGQMCDGIEGNSGYYGGQLFSSPVVDSIAILTQPFMQFQAKRLWQMLGERGRVDETLWDSANSFDSALEWNPSLPSPLFSRLDLDEILMNEKSIAESNTEGDNKGIPDAAGGGKYIDFEDFLKVEMKTGRILSVENHPDADTLYVVQIEDGPNSKRTVCAGLKKFYDIEELIGMSIIFVANLKPRKLRGVVSEGMMLAAEDSEGNVRLLTPDGDLPPGSIVR